MYPAWLDSFAIQWRIEYSQNDRTGTETLNSSLIIKKNLIQNEHTKKSFNTPDDDYVSSMRYY